jgi:hypothetical protein
VLTLAEHFCKAMAWWEMRLVDDITDVAAVGGRWLWLCQRGVWGELL